MKNCSDLLALTALACQIAECLSDEELAVLSADFVVLGDMLANILARRSVCKPEETVAQE